MDQFKAPDLSAPRYRGKSKQVLNVELYKQFLEKYPQYSDVSLNQFKEVIRTYNGNISEFVRTHRDGVELPEGLGYVFIGVCPKTRKSNPDYAKSIQYGKVVNHRNLESDNYLCKIFYTNYALKYRFRDRELWKFIAVKQFRQAVSATFSDLYNNYIFVDNNQKISEMYQKAVRKDYAEKKEQEALEDYDEFKFD